MTYLFTLFLTLFIPSSSHFCSSSFSYNPANSSTSNVSVRPTQGTGLTANSRPPAIRTPTRSSQNDIDNTLMSMYAHRLHPSFFQIDYSTVRVVTQAQLDAANKGYTTPPPQVFIPSPKPEPPKKGPVYLQVRPLTSSAPPPPPPVTCSCTIQ